MESKKRRTDSDLGQESKVGRDTELGIDSDGEEIIIMEQNVTIGSKNLNGAGSEGRIRLTLNIFCWNCRGPGTLWAVQFFKEIVLLKKSNFIFMCEIL